MDPLQSRRKYSAIFQQVFASNANFGHEAITVSSDHLAFLQNSFRVAHLTTFRKELLVGLNQSRSNLDDTTEEQYEYIYSLARNVTKWVFNRHVAVTEWVKTKHFKGKDLIRALENYHWCLVAAQTNSREIDEKIWDRFAVQVEGNSSDMPASGDPNFEDIEPMKERANQYFMGKLQEIIKQSPQQDLVDAALHITQLSSFMKLFAFLLPQILVTVPVRQFQEDILPKICIYALLYRKSFTGAMVEALLKRCSTHVTPDLISSIIEYSSHCLQINLLGFIFDTFKQHVRTEGILCGLLAATIKGNQQLMAMYHFHVIERLEELYNKESGTKKFELVVDATDFAQFAPPFIYILFAASSDAVHAINEVVADLIQFYEKEPMQEILLEGGITQDLHLHFIDGVFNWACKLNHFNVVQTLLDGNWLKTNFVTPISNAVKAGHQKILHLLLETLLSPDPVLELPYGAIPLCFRKNQALKLLPMVAQRFPAEATWFINSISNIPIPIAVPANEGMDPIVKSEMVEGIRLGSASLAEVAKAQEAGIPHENVWSKLDRVGQLHKISSRTSGEVESVVCMVPEMFLKEPAIREGQISDSIFKRETNSLIRLLATEEEEIILSPIIQGLMEYHWASGFFWMRFGCQFLSMVGFIVMAVLLFASEEEHSPEAEIASAIMVILAVMFLFQEVRQYRDDSKEYIKSGSNLIDVLMYSSTIVVICLIHFVHSVRVHPLIKALIILFSTMRLLLHLRIFPSVGPIVRITSSALLNVVPILVPMSFLLVAYSSAFYIIHQELIGPNSNFNSILTSLQYTTTMITFDYTMLQFPNLTPVFLIRIMFHATFLICFINLIVALMTVNVADVTSNMQAAWLVEISQLMIELELYWPRPYSYVPILQDTSSDVYSAPSSIMGLDKVRSFSIQTHNNPESKEYLLNHINVILYTAPREEVAKGSWWTDFPKIDGKGETQGLGSSMFDMDFDFEEKKAPTPLTKQETDPDIPIRNFGPTHLESFPSIKKDITIEAEGQLTPPIPKISERSASGISWVKNPQNKSFNGSPLKRRMTTTNPHTNSIALSHLHNASPNMLLGKALFSDMPNNSGEFSTRDSRKSIGEGSRPSILNRIQGHSSGSGPVVVQQPEVAYASIEHVQHLERIIKYEFKKNRELFSKVEELLLLQKNEKQVTAELGQLGELTQVIQRLQTQVDRLQENRPNTLMQRLFGTRRAQVHHRSEPSLYDVKKSFPYDL